MTQTAPERLAAGIVKHGVSISIDREYVGSKHVILDRQQLGEFIAHLTRLHDKLIGRPAIITRTYTDYNGVVLVTVWPTRQMDVQLRRSRASEWGMPIRCHEELDDVRGDTQRT